MSPGPHLTASYPVIASSLKRSSRNLGGAQNDSEFFVSEVLLPNTFSVF